MHCLLEELSHHCHFQIHIMSFFVSFDNIMDKGSMKKHAVENDLPEQKPKTKKAKLAELLQFSSNLPKHSQNALAAILEKAKKSGIPGLHSSNQQREARLQLLDSCHGGALGPLIQDHHHHVFCQPIGLHDGHLSPRWVMDQACPATPCRMPRHHQ